MESVTMYTTDPLSDNRWGDLVAWHPRASVFHQRAWLEALKRTYGYAPFVLTTTPDGQPLVDGLVLCEVASWITGKRAVSLPFSDHCDPLLDANHQPEFARWLTTECGRQRWKYVELRPQSWTSTSHLLAPSQSFCFHSLDLTRSLEEVFRNFHKDSLQRRIRRAEREGLVYDSGCSVRLRDEFYGLLLKTRRRHRLPPQPRSWFKNLSEGFGSDFQIRVARKDDIPIAALLTLRHRSTVVYKYGCSDEIFHRFAGVPFLFWKLIEESKEQGMVRIDFGRSDLTQKGLVAFKNRFGADRSTLTYLRYPAVEQPARDIGWGQRVLKKAISWLPNSLLPIAGRALYKHVG